MYKVYYKSKEIRFLPENKTGYPFEVVKIKPGDSKDLWEVFYRFVTQKNQDVLGLVSDDPGRTFRAFSLNFRYLEAAGGVVKNPMGDLLFIFRLGKWDLPKGKTDRGEYPEQTAIREVDEECGVSKLRIIQELHPTFHVYPIRDGHWALKKTHWFEMSAGRWQQTRPQTEEYIEKVEWKSPYELNSVLDNTYQSLKDLISSFSKSSNKN